MSVLQLSLLSLLVAVPACACFVLGRLSSQRSSSAERSPASQPAAPPQKPSVGGATVQDAAKTPQPQVEQLLQQLQQARHDDQALVRLTDQLNALVAGREQLQSRLDSLERRFNQQASQPGAGECPRAGDLLAALPDGRAFESAASAALEQAAGGDPRLSLWLIDVDHFQQFSTAHGRAAGDEALRSIAQVLLDTVDANSRVARYSQSEFAVLLPDTDLANAAETAERVRNGLARTPVGAERAPLTISSGIAAAAPGENLAQWLARADEARTAASQAGGDRTLVHDGSRVQGVAGRGPTPALAAPQRGAAEQAAAGPAIRPNALQPAADSRTDAETGLRNQSAFLEDLRRRVAEWRRFKLPISVMCVEVDDLLEKTRDLGPQVGNLLTRAVTQFLATALRDTDLLARLPDSRFGIILPGTDPTNGVRAAERIRGAVSLCRLSLAGRELGFSISLGLASVADGEDAEGLLERAQQATDHALGSGGNTTYVHDIVENRPRPGKELLAAPELACC